MSLWCTLFSKVVSHQLAARIPAFPLFVRFDSAVQSLTHTVQKKNSSINSAATRFCRFYHAPPSHSRVDFIAIFSSAAACQYLVHQNNEILNFSLTNVRPTKIAIELFFCCKNASHSREIALFRWTQKKSMRDEKFKNLFSIPRMKSTGDDNKFQLSLINYSETDQVFFKWFFSDPVEFLNCSARCTTI